MAKAAQRANDDDRPTLVPYLKPGNGEPYLQGARCEACGHVFVGTRQICAKCSTRGRMTPIHLAETGELYSWTIIYRSFPGVDTPFIDAIVDLDDGAHLKGTLVDVPAEPEQIPFGMRVRIVYREVEPPNANGQSYLTYYFVPAEGADEGDRR